MKNDTFLSIREGERKREDLYIPILHYPTVDPLNEHSWIKYLGPKTFVAWLQLTTLVDRRKTALDIYGNQNTVPRSLESLAKVLDMSRPTLYKIVIKPLWNFGFIDLVEWSDQKYPGTKAINIIVYPYPQNDKLLENQILTKVRDYDTDYSSDSKVFSQMASQTRANNRSEKDAEIVDEKTPGENDGENFNENVKEDVFENIDIPTRKETFTGGVKKPLRGGVKKPLPNNNTNTLVNNSNALFNSSNTISSKEEEEKDDNIYIGDENNENIVLEIIGDHLKMLGLDDKLIADIKNELKIYPRFSYNLLDVNMQLHNMQMDINLGKKILNYSKYFVLGLEIVANKNSIENLNVAAFLPQQPATTQNHKHVPRVPFYNWLVERD